VRARLTAERGGARGTCIGKRDRKILITQLSPHKSWGNGLARAAGVTVAAADLGGAVVRDSAPARRAMASVIAR